MQTQVQGGEFGLCRDGRPSLLSSVLSFSSLFFPFQLACLASTFVANGERVNQKRYIASEWLTAAHSQLTEVKKIIACQL